MHESDVTNGYGFKKVDVENLTKPDPLVLGMATRDGDEFRPMMPEDSFDRFSTSRGPALEGCPFGKRHLASLPHRRRGASPPQRRLYVRAGP